MWGDRVKKSRLFFKKEYIIMVLQLAFDVPDERTALFLGEGYSGDLRKCGIVEGEYPIKRKKYETDAINCR